MLFPLYATMLLWISPSSDKDDDDDEKSGKLRRRKVARRRQTALIVVGCLLVLGFQVVFEMEHRQRPKQVRGSSKQQLHRQEEAVLDQPNAAVDDLFAGEVAAVTLPEQSIYRLSYPDINGEMISFSRFSGMLSLVVNTACL